MVAENLPPVPSPERAGGGQAVNKQVSAGARLSLAYGFGARLVTDAIFNEFGARLLTDATFNEFGASHPLDFMLNECGMQS